MNESFVESDYRQSLIALNRTGILSILPKSEILGVIGADGQEYPVPTWKEVEEFFDRNRELVKTKFAQGFTKLQLTPLAAPIPVLVARLERTIVKHNQEGRLFRAKAQPSDLDVPTRADTNESVRVGEVVREAIKNDEIVYFPTRFESNHEGRSKTEIIKDPKICPIPGWSVDLIEDEPLLPEIGHEKTFGERKQLENGNSPKTYLERIVHDKHYRGELGFTLEHELVRFICHLEKTGQVSSDWEQHSGVWIIGNYVPKGGFVLRVNWSCDHESFLVNSSSPSDCYPYFGVRSTIILS